MKIISFILVFLCFSCKEKSKDLVQKNTTETVSDSTLKWIDYRIGELPPAGYYDAFDSILKKWDIKYERIEGGCEALEDEKKEYEKNNPKYFQVLKEKFGENWRENFDAEVAALEIELKKKPQSSSLNHSKKIDCVDKGGSMENGFTTECFYENYTLESAYLNFRKSNLNNDDGKFLEEEMPKKVWSKKAEYPIETQYSYPKPTTLKVDLIFPGGETEIIFSEENSGVKITTISSPD